MLPFRLLCSAYGRLDHFFDRWSTFKLFLQLPSWELTYPLQVQALLSRWFSELPQVGYEICYIVPWRVSFRAKLVGNLQTPKNGTFKKQLTSWTHPSLLVFCAWARGRKPSGLTSGFFLWVFSCRSEPCEKKNLLKNLVFTYFNPPWLMLSRAWT